MQSSFMKFFAVIPALLLFSIGCNESTVSDLLATTDTTTVTGTTETTKTCVDDDGDGFGPFCEAGPDCDDTNAAIHTEMMGYTDADGDGIATSQATLLCTGGSLPAGYIGTVGSDCNDGDPNSQTTIQGYIDNDGDGYGAGAWQSLCAATDTTVSMVLVAGDCDDSDAAAWKLLQGHIDADGDGAGSDELITGICGGSSLPAGYVVSDNDCDDNDPDNQNSCESCVDIDGDGYFVGCGSYTTRMGPDCNDDSSAQYEMVAAFVDADNDSYTNGDPSVMICGGTAYPPGYRASQSAQIDCEDNDPTAWQTLSGYADKDNDGNTVGGLVDFCTGASLPAGYVSTASGNDCNDFNGAVYQSVSVNKDQDGDGYTDGSMSMCIGATPPSGYTLGGIAGDCNDADPEINPGAADLPGDFTDTDCSGGDNLPVDADGIFVAPAPTGNDSFAGTRAAPVSTITHALTLTSASQPNIYAAAGTFAESVSSGAGILGGFANDFLSQDPETYKTILKPVTAGESAFRTTRTVILAGVYVQNNTYAAGGASIMSWGDLTIRKSWIWGPDMDSTIGGGLNQGDGYGVWATGALKVYDSWITGGQSAVDNIAIYSQGDTILGNNTIWGGNRDENVCCFGGAPSDDNFGVYQYWGTLKMYGNWVSGGDGYDWTHGVYFEDAHVNMSDNTIYGGNSDTDDTRGVYGGHSGDLLDMMVTFSNNWINGGTGQDYGAGSSGWSRAVETWDNGELTVSFNGDTIDGGTGYYTAGIYVGSSGTYLTVENLDILGGIPNDYARGLYSDEATVNVFSSTIIGAWDANYCCNTNYGIYNADGYWFGLYNSDVSGGTAIDGDLTAVYFEDGDAEIIDNVIYGGSGNDDVRGIERNAGEDELWTVVIDNNDIDGGRGDQDAYGIDLNNNDWASIIRITNNDIFGGTGDNDTWGIYVYYGIDVLIANNTIDGGGQNCSSCSWGSDNSYGIELDNIGMDTEDGDGPRGYKPFDTNFWIINNDINGGRNYGVAGIGFDDAYDDSGPAVGVIRDNTIVGGLAKEDAIGIYLSEDINVEILRNDVYTGDDYREEVYNAVALHSYQYNNIFSSDNIYRTADSYPCENTCDRWYFGGIYMAETYLESWNDTIMVGDVIEDCTLAAIGTGDEEPSFGASDFSSTSDEDVVFINNLTAMVGDCYDGDGDTYGLDLYYVYGGVIENSYVIAGDADPDDYDSIGIYLDDGGIEVINSVVIAGDGEEAYGLYQDGGTVSLINSIIAGGYGVDDSYGIYNSSDYSTFAVNSTIRAGGVSGDETAYAYYRSSCDDDDSLAVIFINSIFDAGPGGGESYGIYQSSGCYENEYIVINNIFKAGTVLYDGDEEYSSALKVNSCAWYEGQCAYASGNISRTPGFVDAKNYDFNLRPDSIAIDNGINPTNLTIQYWGTDDEDNAKLKTANLSVPVYDDVDGDPRPAGSAYDIGAQEFQP